MSPVTWVDHRLRTLGHWHLPGIKKQHDVDEFLGVLEYEMNAAFPAEYRRFVALVGGEVLGDYEHQIVVPAQDRRLLGFLVPVEFVFAASTEHPDGVGQQLESFRTVLPKGVMPFAEYAARKLLCLDVGGERPGTVWMWRNRAHLASPREGPMEPDHSLTYRDLYRISDSFSDFLQAAYRVRR